jgi:hypothetical protein
MNFNIPKKGQYLVLQNSTNISLAEGTDFMKMNFMKNYWELVGGDTHLFMRGVGFEILKYDNEDNFIVLGFEDLPNPGSLLTRKIYDGRLYIHEDDFEKIEFEIVPFNVYDLYQTLGHDEFFKQTYGRLKEKEILVI